MIEKESRRLMINLSQPLPFLGFAFNFQIRLIESCISPNTLVAPIIRETKPTIVAKITGIR